MHQRVKYPISCCYEKFKALNSNNKAHLATLYSRAGLAIWHKEDFPGEPIDTWAGKLIEGDPFPQLAKFIVGNQSKFQDWYLIPAQYCTLPLK